MLAGQQIVAGHNLATILPCLDFETYSAAGLLWNSELRKWKSLPGLSDQNRGLGAVGVRNYVEHGSFQLLCLTYDLKDGRGEIFWRNGDPDYLLAPLFEYVQLDGLLEAWNSGFEYSVWNYHCVPKLGWPILGLEQMRCCMSKARAWALPGKLLESGRVLQLANQKGTEGTRLIRKLTMPRNPTAKDPRMRIALTDPDPDWQTFWDYNRQDVRAESEANSRIPDLSADELGVWLCDQRINQRGVQIDVEAVENCIAIVEQAHAKYNAELAALTGGFVKAASELPALKAWLETQGVTMASMDAEHVDEAIKRLDDKHTGGEIDIVQEGWLPAFRALQIRQMIGSASVKKLFSIRAQADASGRLYDLYSYYAARTGRWTGNGPQPQNLYKGAWKDIVFIRRCLDMMRHRSLELIEYEYGDALEAINNCLRSLFIAKPGYRLISSDYSAIEGVVTAAVAGEEWRLEVFRTHGMIYETSASAICGIPFQEFVDYKRINGTHHPMRNKIGKFAELSCGFGGWIGAMKGFGADEFLSEDEMKQSILAWRKASPMIVELWGGQTRGRFDSARPELYGLEGAAINAIKNPGQAYTYRCIAFQVHDDVLYMRLPSGRFLTYHRPRLGPSDREWAQPWEVGVTFEGWNGNREKGPIGWLRMKLYGGILTENAVQAIARDIQARALVRLEKAGYYVVMHTHDEAICECPDGFGSVAELEAIMTDLPVWCADWPIKATGGWEGRNYGKFE